MPPKKNAPVKATSPKPKGTSKVTKAKAAEQAKGAKASTRKPAVAPTPASNTSKSSIANPTLADKPSKTATSGTKRKAYETESEIDEEPAPKKSKATPATTKAAPEKPIPTAKAPAAKKTAAKKTASPVEKPAAEVVSEKDAISKKVAVAKLAPVKKFGPAINKIPTTLLDVFVFGEGTAGELGLGATKFEGKSPIDVKRPRLNHRLPAKDVGVVHIAVGGMHCAALTRDNKILTWGVNDNGALGRATTSEGKMRDITKDGSDSDSDSDDSDDSGLNPSEAEPREVDQKYFPEGTKFCQLVASDSATFAVTEQGLVYGWGTFRGNDGVLGFRSPKDVQLTPVLVPELKNVTALAAGTNHILALTSKGKVFAWGAGEQNQLARRVVQRTAAGALVPREFGLKGTTIHIGCGDYHSFAVNKDGTVRAWGLNSWGECGIPKNGDGDNDIVENPTVIKSLAGYSVKQVNGGGHHTIAVTESGQVLTWGRIDLSQGGMEPSKFPKDAVFLDENGRPRYLVKPAVIPGINGESVSAGTDNCLVVTKEGQAYSWGFSENYQTGQGDSDDVKEATLIDNGAIRGKKLCWAGAGGQFSILCSEADTTMGNV